MSALEAARLPLTAAQSALWFAQQLEPTSPAYRIASCTEVIGPLDAELLRQAFAQMSMEAQTMRASFGDTEHGPAQHISAEPRFATVYRDVTGEPDPRAAALAWMERDVAATPALGEDGAFGANRLFKIAEDHFLWYRQAHHLLIDGYASVTTVSRTAQLYTQLSRGERSPSPFGDLHSLIADDHAYRDSDQIRADREFWVSYLDGSAGPATLSGRSGGTPHRPRRGEATVDSATVAGLDRAAQRAGVTWARLTITLMAIYLHRMTGARDVTLGVPVAARMTPLARTVPGVVSNVVPLRCTLTPDLTIAECATRVSQNLDSVLRHQRYRTERMRRELGLVAGERLYGPQINVMPFYGDLSFNGMHGPTRAFTRGPFEDMSIAITRHQDGHIMLVGLDADPALYSAADLAAHQARFVGLLQRTERNLDSCIGTLQMSIPGLYHSESLDWNRVDELSNEEVDRLLQQLALEEAALRERDPAHHSRSQAHPS